MEVRRNLPPSGVATCGILFLVMRRRFDLQEKEESAMAFAQSRARSQPSLLLFLLMACYFARIRVFFTFSACDAFANAVFWEQLERIILGRHKSQYLHAVQHETVQQNLAVGDLWNYSLSALESHHTEVGRVADRTGCKRINADGGGAK
eukprot:6209905-Pleurochrysis_carterae.AAC.1